MLCRDYESWKVQSVIKDCLSEIGLHDLARKVKNISLDKKIIANYVYIITSIAKKHNNIDVINYLNFSITTDGGI